MPVIPTYIADVGSSGAPAGRRSTAADFGGQSGDALVQAGQEGRQESRRLMEANEQRDLITASRDVAVRRQRIREKLDKMKQSGEPITEEIQELLDAQLSDLEASRETRRGRILAQRMTANITKEVLQEARAHDASLVGTAAEDAVNQVIQSNGVALQQDPSVLPRVLAEQNDFIDALDIPKHLKEGLRQELSAEAAKNAVVGEITADPYAAKEKLESGDINEHLEADARKTLLDRANVAIRAEEVEKQRLQAKVEEQEKEAKIQEQNAFLDRLVNNELTPEEVANSNLDPFGSGSKIQFLNMIRARSTATQTGEGIRNDPAVFQQLWDRIHLPDGDPNKLVDSNELNSYLGDGLDVQHINILRQEAQGAKTREGKTVSDLKAGVINIAKGKLTKTNPMVGISDPEGDEQLQKFMSFFLQEFQRKREDGVPARDLLTPGNKEYLGQYINQYQRSSRQIIEDIVRRTVGRGQPATQPPPGITQQEWEYLNEEERARYRELSGQADE